MTTLFDTCALVAVLNPTEQHHKWSLEQLEACKIKGAVVICDIIYSELSVAMLTRAEIDEVIARLAIDRLPGDDEVLFAAGKAYGKYKKTRGTKTNVLPDFLIGAAAEVSGVSLVTTNPKDFIGYFPKITIIRP